MRTWARTRHDLLSQASAKLIWLRDLEDPAERLGARFDDAADSGDEEEWSGEEGGGSSRRSSASIGADARSALWRAKRRRNMRAAAFAAEEAEVFKKYAVLYAAGHTLNEQALVWVRDQDGHREMRG